MGRCSKSDAVGFRVQQRLLQALAPSTNGAGSALMVFTRILQFKSLSDECLTLKRQRCIDLLPSGIESSRPESIQPCSIACSYLDKETAAQRPFFLASRSRAVKANHHTAMSPEFTPGRGRPARSK